tara:strand:- start:959 stop:1420 length:462 start_codon:yes stop_codon:yes gene_type:complete
MVLTKNQKKILEKACKRSSPMVVRKQLKTAFGSYASDSYSSGDETSLNPSPSYGNSSGGGRSFSPIGVTQSFPVMPMVMGVPTNDIMNQIDIIYEYINDLERRFTGYYEQLNNELEIVRRLHQRTRPPPQSPRPPPPRLPPRPRPRPPPPPRQ